MIRLYGDLSPSIHIDIKHALQWLMIRLYGDLSPSIHIPLHIDLHSMADCMVSHNMHSSGYI